MITPLVLLRYSHLWYRGCLLATGTALDQIVGSCDPRSYHKASVLGLGFGVADVPGHRSGGLAAAGSWQPEAWGTDFPQQNR